MILGSWELDILTLIGLIIISAYLVSKGRQEIGVPQVVGSSRVAATRDVSFPDLVPPTLAHKPAFVTQVAARPMLDKAMPEAGELGRAVPLEERHQPSPSTPSLQPNSLAT